MPQRALLCTHDVGGSIQNDDSTLRALSSSHRDSATTDGASTRTPVFASWQKTQHAARSAPQGGARQRRAGRAKRGPQRHVRADNHVQARAQAGLAAGCMRDPPACVRKCDAREAFRACVGMDMWDERARVVADEWTVSGPHAPPRASVNCRAAELYQGAGVRAQASVCAFAHETVRWRLPHGCARQCVHRSALLRSSAFSRSDRISVFVVFRWVIPSRDRIRMRAASAARCEQGLHRGARILHGARRSDDGHRIADCRSPACQFHRPRT